MDLVGIGVEWMVNVPKILTRKHHLTKTVLLLIEEEIRKRV